ncbi:hypothetical protein GXW82_34985 [Streptacidiphilus sp. 4-A2]|nr:hypothetical protein [Streptacidiphilus sp. 4-A2]
MARPPAAPGRPAVRPAPAHRLPDRHRRPRRPPGNDAAHDAADGDVRVRWAPHSRCEDPAIALTRARALLAPTARPGNSPGEKSIQEAAQTLLRCWLHAAALDRRPFRHVMRWAGAPPGRRRSPSCAPRTRTPPVPAGAGSFSRSSPTAPNCARPRWTGCSPR